MATTARNHPPYNVAKHCLELAVSIDRIRLKGNYGDGFSGAPLRVTPATDRTATGNRLEALRGDRAGIWSIRINVQWRLCFVWRNGDAYDVEIVDYH